MSNKPSIWTRADGSVYRNNGPINPVADKDIAHTMALAGAKVMADHDRALELANGSDPMEISSGRLGRIGSMNTEELAIERDGAEERIRRGYASQDIGKAAILYDLEQLSPPHTQE